MRNARKTTKHIICFSLLILYATSCFATVVSDNDGAAFISKAEFDSLKNGFQSEIDTINANIDNKIDSAIDAYISGIKKEAETVIKPIVSNYKDIKWKNDFFMKLDIRKFTNYNTYTDTGLRWQRPEFGEYRIMRAGRYYMGAMDYRDTEARVFFLGFEGRGGCWFPMTGGWLPSGEGVSSTRTNNCGPVVIMCNNNDNGPVIATNDANAICQESQMIDKAFPAIAIYYGGNIGDNTYRHWGTIVPNTDGGVIKVEKEDDDILAWKLKWYNRSPSFSPANEYTYDGPWESNVYRIKKSMSGYGEAQMIPFRTISGPTQIWNNANLGTFNTPVYYNRSENGNQFARDLSTFKVMFLGNDVDTEVNCAVKNATRFFSPWTEYNFTDSKMGSIENKSAYIRAARSGRGAGINFNFVDESDTTKRDTIMLNLPLWPKYKLKDLYNPDFVFNGNSLAIGGGIPIASNIMSKGVLNVKLKYEVGNDDLNDTTVPSQEVYMSFKKTAFNDKYNTDNYYKDSLNNKLKDIQFAKTTLVDTYEVNIPVDTDDNVWFRIGPKERNGSGLYANLTDMQVTLIT